MIKERDLVKLGFIKMVVSAEDAGDNSYYYYTFQPCENANFCLISDASDQVKKGWVISFFDDDIEIKEKEDLIQLINVLKRISK